MNTFRARDVTLGLLVLMAPPGLIASDVIAETALMNLTPDQVLMARQLPATFMIDAANQIGQRMVEDAGAPRLTDDALPIGLGAAVGLSGEGQFALTEWERLDDASGGPALPKIAP